MVMSSRRQLEARLVGTSSSLEKLRIDAKPAAQTILVSYAADATTLRTIQDIWSMSAYPWAIAGAAIVETRRHGGCQYTVQYTPHTMSLRIARTRERLRYCTTSLSRPFA